MQNQTSLSMRSFTAAMRCSAACAGLVFGLLARGDVSSAQSPFRVTAYAADTAVTLSVAVKQAAVEPAADAFPILPILAVLAGILLLSQFVLVLVLVSQRRILNQIVRRQDAHVSAVLAHDLVATLQLPQSWQTIAEKLTADALGENIALATDRGILDVATERSLRFTLMTRDGRTVTFTTNPRLMKRIKLIRRGDKVVNVSRLSAADHVEVNLLWQAILTQRSMPRVTPPSTTPWYVVVRDTVQRNGPTRGGRK